MILRTYFDNVMIWNKSLSLSLTFSTSMQIHNSCICRLHFSRVGFKISPVLKMFVYLWHISQLDWIGFIIGYGVSTALRIVFRPTPFLTITRLTNVQISNKWIRCRWFWCASIASNSKMFDIWDLWQSPCSIDPDKSSPDWEQVSQKKSKDALYWD